MNAIPFIPITDDATYQGIAGEIADNMARLLHQTAACVAGDLGTTDAGPVISGFAIGLMQYVFDTGGDWAEVEAAVRKQWDVVLPQLEMHRAASTGPNTEGTA